MNIYNLLLQVVEAMEGPALLYRCLRGPGSCEVEPHCAACEVWCDIQARFVQNLDAVTMRELSSRHMAK